MSTTTLSWKADGDLTRLVADLDGEGELLVIDYDPKRRGAAKWHLTWIAPRIPSVPEEGQVLHSHATAADLKDEAEFFIDESDDEEDDE